MAHPLIKHILFGALCAGTAFTFVGCTDDSYDLDKVDLTMGIGSEGLSVTLGNTEKILLNDILDTDGSVKTDKENLYYLVKKEDMSYEINVKKVTTNINSPEITTRVLQFPTATTIPNGTTHNGKANGTKAVNVNIKTSGDVISVKSADVQTTSVSLVLSQINSTKLSIKEINNLTITLPSYLKVTCLTSGWTLNGNVLKKTGSIQSSQLGKEICKLSLTSLNINQEVYNNALAISGNVQFSADVTYVNNSGSAIQWKTTDYADVKLNVNIGTGNSTKDYALNITNVTGKFNPAINPAVHTINIKEDLPDFLNDNDVALDVSNPTVRLESDLTKIPVGVIVGCDMTAKKANAKDVTVKIPQSVTLDKLKKDTAYFYQGDAPYDPENLNKVTTSNKLIVDKLHTLVSNVPDMIICNMQNGKITVQKNEYTVELGKKYAGTIAYNIFVPFKFNNGLSIAYKDSTNSLNSDLKKYSAKGITLTTDAQNTIPLDLKVTIEAIGLDGKTIKGIKFNEVTVPASTDGKTVSKKDSLLLEATIDNPSDLSLVDRFMFKVKADNQKTSNQKLVSTQYLKLNNIKLRLKGGVTIDFN